MCMGTGPDIRVRGIYATALSVWCEKEQFDLVDPSSVIANRLQASFVEGVPNVLIRDSRDRQGVEVSGSPDAVREVVAGLDNCSRDTLSWAATLTRGGIYSGVIRETVEGGAIVEIGPEMTGYLPFGNVDRYVDIGDRVVTQVIDPISPWIVGRKPVLDTDIRIPGTYVSLVYDAEKTLVNVPNEALSRMVDMLDVSLPDAWGVSVSRRADRVDPTVIRDELQQLIDLAGQLLDEHALDQAPAEEEITFTPFATYWCRFGREGRFHLDTYRSQVTPTIDGHHRIKSHEDQAYSAVEFLEHYPLEDIAFDPDILFDVFGPTIGDHVQVDHGKVTGESIILGRGSVIDQDEDGAITIERTFRAGGLYDALETPIEENDRAETTFVEGRWWYPTIYRSAEGTYKGTYVNIGTPLEILPDRVRYVDLEIDVVKFPDGTVRIVDRDALDNRVTAGLVTSALAERAESVATAVADAF